MSAILPPFNVFKWIEENRGLLKPPVGNQQIYKDNENFIVMVVGGPNSRKDFHYNETEELFFQLEGDINVRIMEDGLPKDISIKEGEMFLLPPKVPHLPQRGPKTVGLVFELYRNAPKKDGMLWYCENCNHKLYEEYFELEDIVTQLPIVMKKFYASESLKTCIECGHEMEAPESFK